MKHHDNRASDVLFRPSNLYLPHNSIPSTPVLQWSHLPEGVQSHSSSTFAGHDSYGSHIRESIDDTAAKGRKKKVHLFTKLWNSRSEPDGHRVSHQPHEASSIVTPSVLSNKTPLLEESHCSSDLSRDAQRVLGGFRQQRESREQKKRQQKKQSKKTASPLCEPDFLGSLVVFPTSFDNVGVNHGSSDESPRPSHRSPEPQASSAEVKGTSVKNTPLERSSLISGVTDSCTRSGVVMGNVALPHVRKNKTSFVAPPPLTAPIQTVNGSRDVNLFHDQQSSSIECEWDDKRLDAVPGCNTEAVRPDFPTWRSTDTPVPVQTTAEISPFAATGFQYVPNPSPPQPPTLEPCLSLEIKFQQPEIAVAPGVTLPLRGVEETVVYMMRSKMAHTTCWSCGTQLRCMNQAEYVLCPTCRVVAPLDLEHERIHTDTARASRRGVALGLTHAEWLHWKDQLGLDDDFKTP